MPRFLGAVVANKRSVVPESELWKLLCSTSLYYIKRDRIGYLLNKSRYNVSIADWREAGIIKYELAEIISSALTLQM